MPVWSNSQRCRTCARSISPIARASQITASKNSERHCRKQRYNRCSERISGTSTYPSPSRFTIARSERQRPMKHNSQKVLLLALAIMASNSATPAQEAIARPEPLNVFRNLPLETFGLSLSANGDLLATVGANNEGQIREARTGKLLVK